MESIELQKQERRVKKAKVTLMRAPQFALWSGVMMLGTTTVVDAEEDSMTAATNGRDEWYGAGFVKSLADKELAFVVLHENLHKGLRHMTVWKKIAEEDAQTANMAMDFVINLIAYKADPQSRFIAMPMRDGKVFGCFDKKYDSMNTKQVYNLLKQEQEEGGGGQGEGEGDGEGGGNAGFDKHDWEGAKELTKEQEAELSKEIDRALRQGQIAAKKAGTGTAENPLDLQDLLEPEVNWQEELAEFVTSVCANKDVSSWRRVNRRFLHLDTYLPTLIGESVGHLAVCPDTSGSISSELTKFLSEIKFIAERMKPEKIDLMYWGSHVVTPIESYDMTQMDTLVESTQPKGGGGTDPECVSQYLSKQAIKPECIIMFTDGHVPNWGSSWEVPILWVVCGNDNAIADTGKTIHIKDNARSV